MTLQQYSGAVHAKAVEDTAFYRHNVLVSLNEVGGDPATCGRAPQEFHEAMRARHARWPFEMSASSTHDTKLGEDVRARISVLSVMPREWAGALSRWSRMSVERLTAYMLKSAREAKLRTSWIDPDPAYDEAVGKLVAGVIAGPSAATFFETLRRSGAGLRARAGEQPGPARGEDGGAGRARRVPGHRGWDLALVAPRRSPSSIRG